MRGEDRERLVHGIARAYYEDWLTDLEKGAEIERNLPVEAPPE
jgi:hypothetical protein